jgi:hypothetical protein
VLRQAQGMPAIVGLEAFISEDEAPVEVLALADPANAPADRE